MEELLKMSIQELWKSEKCREIKKLLSDEEFKKGAEKTITTEFCKKNGSLLPVEIKLHAVEVDRIIYGLVVARDITERKKAEEALHYRLSIEKLVTDISTGFINLSRIDLEKKILEALRSAGEFAKADRCYIYLYNHKKLIIEKIYEWCKEGVESQKKQITGLSIKPFPWLLEQVNNEYIYIPEIASLPAKASLEKEAWTALGIKSLLSFPMRSKDKFIGVFGFETIKTLKKWKKEDITLIKIIGELLVNVIEKKEAEEKNIRLATAVEQSAESVIITNWEGKIQYVNPAFEEITGYTFQEVRGQNPSILKSGKHDNNFHKNLWNTIKEGKIWKGHFINKKKDGTLYETESSVYPIKDSTGKITSYVSVKRDVTDKIKMEKQLRHAQKMEAIGTLAGGIAHDFNNILSGILGYTELAMYDLPEKSMAKLNLKEAVKAGYRAKELVKQILTFSRRTEEEKKAVQIGLIIKEALHLLKASLPSTIKIQQNIKAKSSIVMADPTQIHQIIMNLCTNAFHAMKGTGGVLKVILCNVEIDKSAENISPSIKVGSYVKLRVEDNGCGIKQEIIDRIFEPYFTTKKEGEGTGMGLAVVHGIIKSYGGEIIAFSRPGEGTAFDIYLPRVEDNSIDSEKTAKSSLPYGKEKILFIDDEIAIVDTSKNILKKLGYSVTGVTNSPEALDIFLQNPDKYDMVITDQTMPGITGSQLARKVMSIRPDIPIILCTGYSETN